jgi:hypothetical protein
MGRSMRTFLEFTLAAAIVAWTVLKFFLQVDYGLAKAIVLFVLPCYAVVLAARQAKGGGK